VSFMHITLSKYRICSEISNIFEFAVATFVKYLIS